MFSIQGSMWLRLGMVFGLSRSAVFGPKMFTSSQVRMLNGCVQNHSFMGYEFGKKYVSFVIKLQYVSKSKISLNNRVNYATIFLTTRLDWWVFLCWKPQWIFSIGLFWRKFLWPTLKAFEMIWERLVPGGVVAFWQLARNTIPAEARVYSENILNKIPHTLHRSPTYPGLCYIKK